MSGKLTWLGELVIAVTVVSSHAADPSEVRLQQEVAEAGASLAAVCRVAWKYDNLRPAMMRTKWLEATISSFPRGPVVHLSEGSPDYRMVVGQMAYWGSVYVSRVQRLGRLAEEKTSGLQRGSAADEEIPGAEREFDHIVASYMRACAWAWPYGNLRPMCGAPGFEPSTFLNPLLPSAGGRIGLSTASPDYQFIVASLNEWRPRIEPAAKRLKDLLADREDAATAAKAVADRGKLPVPPTDARLARMFTILDKLKPLLVQFRADQRKIEELVVPLRIAAEALMTLQFQAQQIQNQRAILANEAQNPKADRSRIQREDRDLQRQLALLLPQIQQARHALAMLEAQIKELQREQERLALQADDCTDEWVRLCDVLGRLDKAAHAQGGALFEQWIADEPRAWQPYLARAAALLRIGRPDRASRDLERVGDKLALYGSSSKAMAFITAIQAYALCKQNDTRGGDTRFEEAKQRDRKSWVPYFFRGLSKLEQGTFSAAERDFQMVAQLSTRAPPGRADKAAWWTWFEAQPAYMR